MSFFFFTDLNDKKNIFKINRSVHKKQVLSNVAKISKILTNKKKR